jgi:hypothetical protein
MPGEANFDELFQARVQEVGGWRGEMLERVRRTVLEADPTLKEFKGASLPDPYGLFNAGLEAKATRSIDIRQGEDLNEPALRDLIRAAVDANTKK